MNHEHSILTENYKVIARRQKIFSFRLNPNFFDILWPDDNYL